MENQQTEKNQPVMTFQDVESILGILGAAPRNGQVEITLGDLVLKVVTGEPGAAGTPPSPAPAPAAPAPAPAAPAPAAPAPATAAPAASAPADPEPAPAAPAPAAPAGAGRGAGDAEEGMVVVESPMTGVFYRSPSPGAPAFAEEGDRVSAGQDLAIIEVMKLMNRLTSPVDGILRRVCQESESLVEHGQALFVIEPLDGAA